MKQFSLFFVLLGIVLLSFSLFSRKRRLTERNRYSQTLGTIIEKRIESAVEDTAMPTRFIELAMLTIRFVTTTGQTVDFIVREPHNSNIDVNDEIRVFYDPARPELATLSPTPTRANLLAVSSTVGGILCLVVGIFLLAAS